MKLLPASFVTALMLAISQLNMSQSAPTAEIKSRQRRRVQAGAQRAGRAIPEGERQQGRHHLSDRRAASGADPRRQGGVRRRRFDAGGDRRARQGRQGRAGHARRSGQNRRRRRGQSRRADAGHSDRRCLQARAPCGEVGRLYRSQGRRIERHLCRRTVAAARHRRRDQRQGGIGAGGAVADHVADGEAEIGIHQISEILPVAGVTLVGPLPAEMQNFTVYAAGIGAAAKDARRPRTWSSFWPDRMPCRSSRPRAWSRRRPERRCKNEAPGQSRALICRWKCCDRLRGRLVLRVQAMRGMSARVMPMSASSRSLRWESSCIATPYRFQSWKSRKIDVIMIFVPFLRRTAGNQSRNIGSDGALQKNLVAAQLSKNCMTVVIINWHC